MEKINNLFLSALQLHQTGKFVEARMLYEQILEQVPNHAKALNLLGTTYLQTGEQLQGLPYIEKAIAINPDFPEAYNNLGTCLRGLLRFDEAVSCYRKAVAAKPDYALAYFNLGISLKELNRPEEAAACYQQAIEIKPDYADAYNNLGMTLSVLQRQDEAATCFRRVLAIKPDFVDACNNLGISLSSMHRHDEAFACFNKALSIKPDCAEAHYNLGSALQKQGRIGEAAECYRRSLSCRPDYAMAYNNLLYLHAFTRDISPESECALASQWENSMLTDSERIAARKRQFSFDVLPRAGRKLKLGIVSAELGQHAVAEFLEPFLEQLDRSRFHLTLYPTAPRSEPRAERFKNLADEYKSLVRLSDNEAAHLIRSDLIDILIDTTGYMKNCRLGIFAHRAAPVQCEYIGYHGTTGLSEMDWLIADEMLLPSSYEAHFREKIWRLPRLRMAYKGDVSLPSGDWKPDSGGIIRLGSFNNLTKVRDEALGLWAGVMHAIPRSKLMLKDRNAVDPAVRLRIRTELARHGITAERIEFIGQLSDWRSHMRLYDRLDIALDTIPLNSETTAFDALWMGVPLVALEGNWYGARMASTLLKALGKAEWVAQTSDQYVEIVTALAYDVEGRKSLRTAQRALMANSPLCDARGLSRMLESALESMFDLWTEKCCQHQRNITDFTPDNFTG